MKKTILKVFFLLLIAIPAFAADMTDGILNAKITIRDDFAIVVDSVTLTPDVGPVEKGGLIFIPIRFAAEALKADVTWYKSDKTVELSFRGGRTVKMTIGDPAVKIGDIEKILPVPPFIFESRAMVPLRAAVEESGIFRIEERENAMILESEEDIKGYDEPGKENVIPGTKQKSSLDMIRQKAKHDPITRKLRPMVLAAWIAIGLLWAAVCAMRIAARGREGWKDLVIIGLFLSIGMYVVLFSGIMMSTYWAAIVILVTSTVGLVSTETYADKLVTMASSAQGAGLICTLFGLGLLIGPAIANRDIAAIGYGIYVKIEPTITGLALSILMNMLYGYEAKKQSFNVLPPRANL